MNTSIWLFSRKGILLNCLFISNFVKMNKSFENYMFVLQVFCCKNKSSRQHFLNLSFSEWRNLQIGEIDTYVCVFCVIFVSQRETSKACSRWKYDSLILISFYNYNIKQIWGILHPLSYIKTMFEVEWFRITSQLVKVKSKSS